MQIKICLSLKDSQSKAALEFGALPRTKSMQRLSQKELLLLYTEARSSTDRHKKFPSVFSKSNIVYVHASGPVIQNCN